MIYFFDAQAGSKTLHIKGEMHKYLVKVRRHCEGDILQVRSKEDINILYRYRVDSLEARALNLILLESEIDEVKSEKELHIAWCVIDSKSVEKMLAPLCEIGVSRISFISCDRSQKNFKQDFKRYERIVEASMQQSGRTSLMLFDSYKNIKSFISKYPDTKVFDFTEKVLDEKCNFQRVLIGCEGGFSPDEKELLQSQEVFRLNSPMVLRSESAVMAVASKILL
jgi:16S rRNA (uracil1498-N3)-methyltransferase